MGQWWIVLWWLVMVVTVVTGQEVELSERDRVQEYYNRGYQWPLPEVIPNTTGWNRIMRRRMTQVEQIDDDRGRYSGWVGTIVPAVVAPNFTTDGFGLTRAPTSLVQRLKETLQSQLQQLLQQPQRRRPLLLLGSAATTTTTTTTTQRTNTTHAKTFIEDKYDAIDAASQSQSQDNDNNTTTTQQDSWQRPWLILDEALNHQVLEELRPMHEAWAGGIPLKGATAYGIRVYRNQSVLHMHVDNFHTHIISSILHIDHDEEPTSKPWPLFLESFDGNTNEIVLESGDLLFYESSKCLHGRPRPFHGSWYASIFIHYYPADNWNPTTKGYDVQYAIPPHWRSKPTTKMDRTSGTSTAGSDPPNAEWDNNNNNNNNLGTLPKLVMIGTNFAEPECPDEWCDTVNTVRWYGPGKEGVIVPPSSSSSSSSSGTEDRDEASRGSMVDESRHLEL